jgi:hypothetical protein
MKDTIHAYEMFVGKFEENQPLGRPRHRWENNLKLISKQYGVEDDWIHEAQNRATYHD